jgi:hypothetical protein
MNKQTILKSRNTNSQQIYAFSQIPRPPEKFLPYTQIYWLDVPKESISGRQRELFTHATVNLLLDVRNC